MNQCLSGLCLRCFFAICSTASSQFSCILTVMHVRVSWMVNLWMSETNWSRCNCRIISTNVCSIFWVYLEGCTNLFQSWFIKSAGNWVDISRHSVELIHHSIRRVCSLCYAALHCCGAIYVWGKWGQVRHVFCDITSCHSHVQRYCLYWRPRPPLLPVSAFCLRYLHLTVLASSPWRVLQ